MPFEIRVDTLEQDGFDARSSGVRSIARSDSPDGHLPSAGVVGFFSILGITSITLLSCSQTSLRRATVSIHKQLEPMHNRSRIARTATFPYFSLFVPGRSKMQRPFRRRERWKTKYHEAGRTVRALSPDPRSSRYPWSIESRAIRGAEKEGKEGIDRSPDLREGGGGREEKKGGKSRRDTESDGRGKSGGGAHVVIERAVFSAHGELRIRGESGRESRSAATRETGRREGTGETRCFIPTLRLCGDSSRDPPSRPAASPTTAPSSNPVQRGPAHPLAHWPPLN